MSNGNGNGDCVECKNGDWYRPPEDGDAAVKSSVEVMEEGCPEALKAVTAQDKGGYKEIGTVWLPIDLFRDHGFTIFAKIECGDSKDPKVGLYLKKVIRESAEPKLP